MENQGESEHGVDSMRFSRSVLSVTWSGQMERETCFHHSDIPEDKQLIGVSKLTDLVVL